MHTIIIKGRAAALAGLSGILAAVSFPKFNLTFFIWIALIPLLHVLMRSRPKNAFFFGLVAGSAYYAVLLAWIPSVPAHYGNLSLFLSIIIDISLVLFLALFWALFGLIFSKIHTTFPDLSLFAAPFIWTALEFALTFVLTGFPWGLLGYSQVGNLWLLQTASVAGVYGISFIIVFLQAMFLRSLTARKKTPFFAALCFILVLHAAGFLALKKTTPTSQTFIAGVIQGNVSSDIEWDFMSEKEIFEIFDRHIDLTRKAREQGARLVVWPEFTMPLCFSCSGPLYETLKNRIIEFVRENPVALLLGTNETSGTPPDLRFHNTSLALSSDLTQTKYHKMHLVPFGEYTPYKSIFGFIKRVTHAIGDVSPGKEPTLHRINGIPYGTPICYEIIFPAMVRRFVREGAEFLVTITNDGWYGTSAAPYHHFQIAVFRAVENRRFLLRAATTGISGVVDPYGRVLGRTRLMTSDILTAAVTPVEKQTIYTKYGDFLPFISLTLTAVLFILALLSRKKGKSWTS